MFGTIETGETNMAKQKNYNKGLVTFKVTVTAQTAWHLNRWSALSDSSIGKVIDKIVRSLTAWERRDE